jgi:hypothetical protein
MKHIFIVIFAFFTWILSAQEYDNLGQMLRIHNVIMGKGIIKGETGLGISQLTYQPPNEALIDYTRITTIAAFDINPVKHFHIKTQLFFDLIKNERTPPYLSNMYYQIGWYNWENKSVSFGYENYGANRFSNQTTGWGVNLKRGFFFTSYNLDLLGDYSSLKFDETSQIRIIPSIRYSLEYPDKFGIEKGGNNKITLSTAARWSIAKRLYIEGAIYYYPEIETRLPWDPDFTYGFGFFNWKAFKLNVAYGNWIANRFPWDKKEMPHTALNGEFKLTFTWAL